MTPKEQRKATVRVRKLKVTFPRGIHTVNIPFMGTIGAFDQIYEEVSKIDYPKSTRRIEASHTYIIELENPQLSYTISEVRLMRKALPRKSKSR